MKEIVNEIIQNRESTFVNGLKEGGKIDDSVIMSLLENAVWAPTHGLTQTWKFVVFSDNGVEVFFKEQQRIYKMITPSEKFNQIKYNSFLDKPQKVSHVIAVLMRRDPKKRFPKQEDIVSTSCAIQNIYLSLSAYGIAGYLSTGDICYSNEIREFLDLNKEDECLGFFQLGIKDESKPPKPRKRISAKEKTKWIDK